MYRYLIETKAVLFPAFLARSYLTAASSAILVYGQPLEYGGGRAYTVSWHNYHDITMIAARAMSSQKTSSFFMNHTIILPVATCIKRTRT